MWGIIFGGSFNPFHEGHEALIEACRKHFGTCHIYIMPLPVGRLSEMPIPDRFNRLNSLLSRFPTISLVKREEIDDDLNVFLSLINEIRSNGELPAVLIGSDVLTRDSWGGVMAQVFQVADLLVGQRNKYEVTASIWKETLAQAAKCGRTVVVFPTLSETSSTAIRYADYRKEHNVG